jgi:hypothetical protein
MKRVLYLFTLAFLLSPITSYLHAQGPPAQPKGSFMEFKVGELDPKDVSRGPFFEISMGTQIDDRLYWGFEGLYFRSSYIQGTVVPDTISGGTIISTKTVDLDYTTTIAGIFFVFSYEYRMGQQGSFYYRASAGGGWEFLWTTEKNFKDGVSRTRTFNSPAFQLTTGIGIRISSTGIFFGDIIYNAALGKTGETRTEEGLPTYTQVDVSGLGFRVGLNLYNFKIF